MPFASTRVVHPRWAEHHRPVAEGAQTATCTITTGGDGTWTPGGGATPGTPTTLYTGTCRVQALTSGDRQSDAVGQDVARHPYLVAIDHDAVAIPVGARVHIDECADDPRMVGMVLTVAETRYGSLRWERDLICDLDPANQEG